MDAQEKVFCRLSAGELRALVCAINEADDAFRQSGEREYGDHNWMKLLVERTNTLCRLSTTSADKLYEALKVYQEYMKPKVEIAALKIDIAGLIYIRSTEGQPSDLTLRVLDDSATRSRQRFIFASLSERTAESLILACAYVTLEWWSECDLTIVRLEIELPRFVDSSQSDPQELSLVRESLTCYAKMYGHELGFDMLYTDAVTSRRSRTRRLGNGKSGCGTVLVFVLIAAFYIAKLM
jgi:hypothetical protein